MLKIINNYIDGDTQVKEYSKDGATISHTVRTPIQTMLIGDEESKQELTIDEQILTETKYQTVLLEMSTGF